MRSIFFKSAFTYLTAMLTLAACSQPPNYAPVKTVNQALAPKNGFTPSPLPHPSTYNQTGGQFKANNNVNNLPFNQNNIRRTALSNNNDAPQKTYSNPALIASDKGNKPAMTTINTVPDMPVMAKSHTVFTGQQYQQYGSNTVKNSAIKQVNSNLAGQSSLNTNKNQKPGQKKNQPIALLGPVNSRQKGRTPQVLEKNSHKEKSILSNDNKKVLKLNFEWPLKGKITRNFVQTENKGIDISGKMGQKVRAAEAGKAVYCGQGLAGFGNLAVIKHNETYLSAYANTSRLFIKEGQRINKGQAIGEVGNSGFKRALLHFEIRKNGKSINPLMVLPKR